VTGKIILLAVKSSFLISTAGCYELNSTWRSLLDRDWRIRIVEHLAEGITTQQWSPVLHAPGHVYDPESVAFAHRFCRARSQLSWRHARPNRSASYRSVMPVDQGFRFSTAATLPCSSSTYGPLPSTSEPTGSVVRPVCAPLRAPGRYN